MNSQSRETDLGSLTGGESLHDRQASYMWPLIMLLWTMAFHLCEYFRMICLILQHRFLIVHVRQAWEFSLPQRNYAMSVMKKIWDLNLVLSAVSLLVLLGVAYNLASSGVARIEAAYFWLPSDVHAAISSLVISLLMAALSWLTLEVRFVVVPSRSFLSDAKGLIEQNLLTAGLFALVVAVHLYSGLASLAVVTIGSLLLVVAAAASLTDSEEKRQFNGGLLCLMFLVYYPVIGLWELGMVFNSYLGPSPETYFSLVVAGLLVAKYRKGELLEWWDVCVVVFRTSVPYLLWKVLSVLAVATYLYYWLSFKTFSNLAVASFLIESVLCDRPGPPLVQVICDSIRAGVGWIAS